MLECTQAGAVGHDCTALLRMKLRCDVTDSRIDSWTDSSEVVKAAYSFFNARDMTLF